MTRSGRALTEEVRELLNVLDPYWLEPGSEDGAPLDEYDFEAQPIADVLERAGAISVEQVDAIWLEWFGDTLTIAVGPDETGRFVADLNMLMSPQAEFPE